MRLASPYTATWSADRVLQGNKHIQCSVVELSELHQRAADCNPTHWSTTPKRQSEGLVCIEAHQAPCSVSATAVKEVMYATKTGLQASNTVGPTGRSSETSCTALSSRISSTHRGCRLRHSVLDERQELVLVEYVLLRRTAVESIAIGNAVICRSVKVPSVQLGCARLVGVSAPR